ncbi:hypothetical protein KEM52_006139 [Ascosphaera acerosa]|nr:hypothetical protein KEM52_006139 [Ascosphaera acerosa]
MCELGVQQTSTWLMVDSWEPMQKEYVPTAKVLDHFDHEINTVGRGIRTGRKDPATGEHLRKPVRIALLAGADLIHTMGMPGVWSQKDLQHILGKYGALIVERTGTDVDEAIASLQQYKPNIYVIHQMVQNDVSSTKIRMFLRRAMSVRYLIPGSVIEYIERNRLYEDNATLANGGNRKEGDEPETKAAAEGAKSRRRRERNRKVRDHDTRRRRHDRHAGDGGSGSKRSASASESESQSEPDGDDSASDSQSGADQSDFSSRRRQPSKNLHRITSTEEADGLQQIGDSLDDLRLTRAESNFNAHPRHPASSSTATATTATTAATTGQSSSSRTSTPASAASSAPSVIGIVGSPLLRSEDLQAMARSRKQRQEES